MTEKINGFNCSLTEQTKKITIKGETLNRPVHLIPLEALIYNEKNGRIATYLSKFKSEEGVIDATDINKFNNVLGRFIRESNPKALDKTRENIRKFGQKQPGVVLSNGIIIDGNRRYTCLRELQEAGTVQYFHAVILKSDYSAREIKSLELNLQHAEERPVDYNPIDDLVDIYRDIVADELFTVEQYAIETNKKPADIRTSVAAAKLMVEFLEFINQKEAFYIARDMTLDGPLREIVNILKKIPEEEQFDVKPAIFTSLLTATGDKTRAIRDLGKHIIHNKKASNFMNEYEGVVKHVFESTRRQGKIETVAELLNCIDSGGEILNDGRQTVDNYINSSKITKARNEPVDLMNKTIMTFSSIDLYTVSKLSPSIKKDFINKLETLLEDAELLRESLNVN